MKSNSCTVHDLFDLSGLYVIQSQYNWSADKQWQPLWEDIERVCIERIKREEHIHAAKNLEDYFPEGYDQIECQYPAGFFLGVIIFETLRSNDLNDVPVRSVFDGAQLLMTLQVFIAALHGLVIKHNVQEPTELLDMLKYATRKMSPITIGRINKIFYKLSLTDMDQPAFEAVMTSGSLEELGKHYPELLRIYSDENLNVAQANTFFEALMSCGSQQEIDELMEHCPEFLALYSAKTPRLAQAYTFFWRWIDDMLTRAVLSENLAHQPNLKCRISVLVRTLIFEMRLVSIETEEQYFAEGLAQANMFIQHEQKT